MSRVGKGVIRSAFPDTFAGQLAALVITAIIAPFAAVLFAVFFICIMLWMCVAFVWVICSNPLTGPPIWIGLLVYLLW